MLALYWLLLLAWIYEQTPIPNFIYLVIFRREVAILLYYIRESTESLVMAGVGTCLATLSFFMAFD